ncbi:MAG: hypothetical protein ACK517_04165, partial [bacterium]
SDCCQDSSIAAYREVNKLDAAGHAARVVSSCVMMVWNRTAIEKTSQSKNASTKLKGMTNKRPGMPLGKSF